MRVFYGLLILLLVAACEPSYAASKATPMGSNPYNTFQTTHPGVSQKVSFTGTSAQSAALTAGVSVVRLHADHDCYILIGANPTALTDGTSMFVGANSPVYVAVDGAVKIAVIALSTSGTLYITEGAP